MLFWRRLRRLVGCGGALLSPVAPASPGHLVLVRHGRTEWDTPPVFQG